MKVGDLVEVDFVGNVTGVGLIVEFHYSQDEYPNEWGVLIWGDIHWFFGDEIRKVVT